MYFVVDDDLNCVFEADNQTNTTCSSGIVLVCFLNQLEIIVY
jgi:hypothetical protein